MAAHTPAKKIGMQKIVVRKEEALKREFKGVSLDSLAVGERSMVAKMNYVKGNFATTHQHPHEQCCHIGRIPLESGASGQAD